MSERARLCREFLATTDWADAERRPLAGDASNRRYERLHDKHTGRTAVFMDAPPEKGEDVHPFVQIANHLNTAGLSAPHLFAQDLEHGFLILEDLGDDLFARVVIKQPALEQTLYQTATDVLLSLHRHALPNTIAPYAPPLMADLAALPYDWYLPALGGENPRAKADFISEFTPLIETHAADTGVLIQRDYHAENLLWLPERDNAARVGLLDFQDAMAGHPAYDLVSLLQDARRDVPDSIVQEMIARYVDHSTLSRPEFEAAYHVLGAQRNLRILGVFARLSIRDGKSHYVDLIPRVWGHVMTNLAHPALAPVAKVIVKTLPAPTPEILQKLKSQCAKRP